MKQTAMQQLLAQLKHERANIPMDIEWDRCYQAIETVIQDIYLPIEKERLLSFAKLYDDDLSEGKIRSREDLYKETYGK